MSSHARPYGFSPHPVTRASAGRGADPGGDPARPVRPGGEAATGDRARPAVRRQQADRARGPRIARERRADPQGPGVAGGSFVNTVTPDSLAASISESMSTVMRLGALRRPRAHRRPAGARGSGGPVAAGHRTDQQVEQLWSIVNASGRRRSTTRTSPPTTSRSTRRSDTPRGTGCWPRSSARCTTPPILLTTWSHARGGQKDCAAAHGHRQGARGRQAGRGPADHG